MNWRRWLNPAACILTMAIVIVGWQVLTRAPAGVPVSAAERAMDRVIPEFKINHRPIPEALEELGRLAGIRIKVDSQLSLDDRIRHTDLIALHLRDVTARFILESLLLRTGFGWEISYDADETGITLIDRLTATLELRVYDVSDLLRQGEEFTARMKPAGPLKPGVAGAVATPSAALHELVISTVDPSSWDVNVGKAALHSHAGRLFVRQTVENHRGIEQLLAMLRAANGGKP